MLQCFFQEFPSDLTLTDISGNTLDALTVFTRTMEYFRNHLIASIKLPEIRVTEIGWVITVPAIWSDSGKKFMRLAAEKVLR